MISLGQHRRIGFFFNDTATTEIYTLSLHDALPIFPRHRPGHHGRAVRRHPRRRHLPVVRLPRRRHRTDRKSTRLNSSHANISYAVFCLKKKFHCTPLTSTPSTSPSPPLCMANASPP